MSFGTRPSCFRSAGAEFLGVGPIQFLVDHIQRKNKAGFVSELPPAIDQVLVTAGLKAKLGPRLRQARRAAHQENRDHASGIEKFDLEVLHPPQYETWGSLTSRIMKSIPTEDAARKRHLEMAESKVQKTA